MTSRLGSLLNEGKSQPVFGLDHDNRRVEMADLGPKEELIAVEVEVLLHVAFTYGGNAPPVADHHEPDSLLST